MKIKSSNNVGTNMNKTKAMHISVIKSKQGGKIYKSKLLRRSYREDGFRTIKTDHLNVRPIYHHSEVRVRAHIFICMLAWYVEWHMREAWRPLLFSDPIINAGAPNRDPVKPAKKSKTAKRKAQSHILPDGTPTHCFTTLMETLASVVQNKCRLKTPESLKQPVEFEMTTLPNKKQKQAIDLLQKVGNLSHAIPRL